MAGPSEDVPASHAWLVLGALLIVAGSLCLHAYFEVSGRSRPWLLKLLPGA